MERKAIADTRGAKSIRQALISLLQERPYQDITVGDIIERSTYSRSCFYHHYCDKLDVAEQAVQEEVLSYVRTLVEQMKRYADISDEVEYNYAISRNTFQYIEKKRVFYHLLFQQKFPEMDLEYFSELAIENFRETAPFRVNPAYSPEELDFFIYCYTHMVLRYIRFWEAHSFSETPEQMAAHTVALCRMSKPGAVFTQTE